MSFDTLVAFVAVTVTACTTAVGPATSATTEASDTVPPAGLTTTTATPSDAPVHLCEGGIEMEPGVSYVAACFLTPITFTPTVDGWHSVRAGLDAVEGHWTEPGERKPSIRFVFLSHLPDAKPSDVIESMLAIEGIEPLGAANTVSGGMTVDVMSAADPNSRRLEECMVSFTWALDLSWNDPGAIIVDNRDVSPETGRMYGLGACHRFRLWALPINGVTVTVIATVDDLDQFDELMPMMDGLLGSIEDR